MSFADVRKFNEHGSIYTSRRHQPENSSSLFPFFSPQSSSSNGQEASPSLVSSSIFHPSAVQPLQLARIPLVLTFADPAFE